MDRKPHLRKPSGGRTFYIDPSYIIRAMAANCNGKVSSFQESVDVGMCKWTLHVSYGYVWVAH